jgi:hypothetical protein
MFLSLCSIEGLMSRKKKERKRRKKKGRRKGEEEETRGKPLPDCIIVAANCIVCQAIAGEVQELSPNPTLVRRHSYASNTCPCP